MHSDDAIDSSLKHRDVLLGDDHGRVAEFDAHQRIDHALADLRREAERRLVDEKQRRIRHQASADRDHAAFAARQPADRNAHQLSQRRKYLQDALFALRPLTPGPRGEGAGIEMLLHGQAMEDLVALRDERQSCAHDLVGVSSRALAARTSDLDAVQFDGAALPTGEPGDCIEQCRLAVTIETDDADAFTGTTTRSRSWITRIGPYPADRPRRSTPRASRLASRPLQARSCDMMFMHSCASSLEVFEICGVDLRIREHVLDQAFRDDFSGIHDHRRGRRSFQAARCGARR